MPLAVPPPAWLATGVELRVPITATAAGSADLVQVTPGPETVVARVAVTAGAPATLATVPPADGSYRYRLVLPGEAARTLPALRVRPVTLAAVGDVSPGSALDAVRAHGAAWHWSKVGAWLRSRDVVVANLETAVGTGGTPWPAKNYHFLSPPATIRAMAKSGGVDVVTVANNHAVDYGRATFVSGLRTIRAAGVLTAGGGSTLKGALKPAIIERGGLRIAGARVRRLSTVRLLGDGDPPGPRPGHRGVHHRRRQGRARPGRRRGRLRPLGAPSCGRSRARSRRRSPGRRSRPAPTSCWVRTRTCSSRS